MPSEADSLEFLTKQAKLDMEEIRHVRKELTDMKRLVNANYELTRRIERRHGELRDDVGLMVKMELGGSLANIQTSIETYLPKIEETVGDVARRVETLENKP